MMHNGNRDILRVISILAFPIFLLFSPADAFAQGWAESGGEPIVWSSFGNPLIERNQCTIPSNAEPNKYWAYAYGSRQWTYPFSWLYVTYGLRPYSDCGTTQYDGISEVAIVTPGTDQLPLGYAGYTLLDYRTFSSGVKEIIEADVLVADWLPFGDPSATSTNAEGRSVFVHEFGHAFGLLHTPALGYTGPAFYTGNEGMSVMRQLSPHPMTGGTPSAVAFPRDAHVLDHLYGSPPGKPNLVISAHTTVGTSLALIDPSSVHMVCKGDSMSVRMYLGNKSHVATGAVIVQARLGPVSRTEGVFVGWAGANLQAFEETLVFFNIQVPSNAPTGVQYLNFDVDPDQILDEVTRDDNWTISGKKINVVDC